MAPGGALKVLELLQRSEDFLREQGCASPRLDAQVLLADVLKCDRVKLYVDYAKPLTEQERDQYRTFIRRRANHEPVAYIVGTKEFWSMEFAVDSRVLIPRPDTETLVEEALERCRGKTHVDLVDVGTGSGCICAALLKEIQNSSAVAIDSADGAMELAEKNFRSHGLQDRVTCIRGDCLCGLGDKRFDLVCANLPYIPSAQLDSLPDDVRLFEPLAALDGGPDGLDVIRSLVDGIADSLNSGGVLVLEVGQGQAEQVWRMCDDARLGSVNIRKDIGGVERVVSAMRV